MAVFSGVPDAFSASVPLLDGWQTGKALTALLEAKRLSGRIIWLNPIPEHRWVHLRSAQIISSCCNMIACNTLQSLAEACRKLANS